MSARFSFTLTQEDRFLERFVGHKGDLTRVAPEMKQYFATEEDVRAARGAYGDSAVSNASFPTPGTLWGMCVDHVVSSGGRGRGSGIQSKIR